MNGFRELVNAGASRPSSSFWCFSSGDEDGRGDHHRHRRRPSCPWPRGHALRGAGRGGGRSARWMEGYRRRPRHGGHALTGHRKVCSEALPAIVGGHLSVIYLMAIPPWPEPPAAADWGIRHPLRLPALPLDVMLVTVAVLIALVHLCRPREICRPEPPPRRKN